MTYLWPINKGKSAWMTEKELSVLETSVCGGGISPFSTFSFVGIAMSTCDAKAMTTIL